MPRYVSAKPVDDCAPANVGSDIKNAVPSAANARIRMCVMNFPPLQNAVAQSSADRATPGACRRSTRHALFNGMRWNREPALLQRRQIREIFRMFALDVGHELRPEQTRHV